MSDFSENDLRWFAAQRWIAFEDTREFGGMSVHELKQALRDIPGAESLTLAYAPNGNELVTIAGHTVEVSPHASAAEIALAFQTPNVTVTPVPPVDYAPAPTIGTKTMSTPNPGSFAASIRAMLDQGRAGVEKAKADGLAQVSAAVNKMNDAKDATAKVSASIAASIHSEVADVMAELGQFSNEL